MWKFPIVTDGGHRIVAPGAQTTEESSGSWWEEVKWRGRGGGGGGRRGCEWTMRRRYNVLQKQGDGADKYY